MDLSIKLQQSLWSVIGYQNLPSIKVRPDLKSIYKETAIYSIKGEVKNSLKSKLDFFTDRQAGVVLFL